MNNNKWVLISRYAQSSFISPVDCSERRSRYTSIVTASLALLFGACSSDADNATKSQPASPAFGSAEVDPDSHVYSLAALQDASSDENGNPTLTLPDLTAPAAATSQFAKPTAATEDKFLKAPEIDSALPTNFTSHTTDGFVGEVLDSDSIKISWTKFPSAIGYNIYRNSTFYRTVFSNSFVDTAVANQESLYYEIEAYDEARNFTRIAKGLTIKLREKLVQLPTQIAQTYNLVFSDEFDGNTLDRSKWSTSYIWGDQIVINSELQFYIDINNKPDFPINPFKVANGVVEINTTPTPQHLKSQVNNQPYLSGVITSYNAFKFTYGYVEARVKLPKGKGFWAAFWLLNAYYDNRKPEIDIMEHLGHKLDGVHHTYHYYDSNDILHSTESQSSTGADFTNDFHVFAVEWKPGTIIYYVDGIERHRLTDANVSDEEMYIIANTAIGGWWPGDPDATTEFPGSYQIDYIRAYQKRGQLDPLPQLDGSPVALPTTRLVNPSPNHLPPFELWTAGYPAKIR